MVALFSEPNQENPSIPMVIGTKKSEEADGSEEVTEVALLVREERLTDTPDWAKALVERVHVCVDALGKYMEEVDNRVGRNQEKKVKDNMSLLMEARRCCLCKLLMGRGLIYYGMLVVLY